MLKSYVWQSSTMVSVFYSGSSGPVSSSGQDTWFSSCFFPPRRITRYSPNEDNLTRYSKISRLCSSKNQNKLYQLSFSAPFARMYHNFISIPATHKKFYLRVFAIRRCCIFHFNRNKPSLGGMYWRLLLFLAHFVTHHFGKVFYIFFLCRLQQFCREINCWS